MLGAELSHLQRISGSDTQLDVSIDFGVHFLGVLTKRALLFLGPDWGNYTNLDARCKLCVPRARRDIEP